MSTVGSRQSKTVVTRTKKAQAQKRAKAAKPKASAAASNGSRRAAPSRDQGPGELPVAVRVLQSLEKAPSNESEARIFGSLSHALRDRPGVAEVAEVADELLVLLKEGHDPYALECLAKDLEGGADADLVGALAGYLKAGLPADRMAAMAWFFPRSQTLRLRQARRTSKG